MEATGSGRKRVSSLRTVVRTEQQVRDFMVELDGGSPQGEYQYHARFCDSFGDACRARSDPSGSRAEAGEGPGELQHSVVGGREGTYGKGRWSAGRSLPDRI